MKSVSVFALITANLVPLFGVIFLGWSLFAIVFLYWFENIVVGFYNVMRMRRAQGEVVGSKIRLNGRPITAADRYSTIIFFIVHYGMFTAVHGIFVFQLFGPPTLSLVGLSLAVVFLFISHGVSYFKNFIGKGEYKRISFGDLFIQPYKRIIVVHITIIFGGMLINSFGAPTLALLVMVFLKIIIDILSHLAEHNKFRKLSPVLSA